MTKELKFYVEDIVLDETLIKNLCDFNGGFSVQPKIGYWKDSQGKVLRENSHVIEIELDENVIGNCISDVIQAGIRQNQHAIGLKIDNEFKLIEVNNPLLQPTSGKVDVTLDSLLNTVEKIDKLISTID
jgi:hypothetical protein